MKRSTAWIILGVLGLHLLIGLGVALSPPRQSAEAAVKPLVLLTELPAPVHTQVRLDVAVPLPRITQAIAVTPPSSDGVILETAPADAAELARTCAANTVQRSRDLRPTPPRLNVLLRVDTDGRVSDSRIIEGSGSESRDAAMLQCLLSHARLQPARVAGRAVVAWQRFVLTGADAARRP